MADGRWSPIVMGLMLSRRLQRAREDAGKTQSAVAAALECSVKKLQYLEDGHRVVSRRDLDALAVLYSLEQEEHELWLRLWGLAQESAWWDDHVAPLNRRLQRVIGIEWGAQVLRGCVPMLVPIHLQTEQYAEALLRELNPHESPRVTSAWVQVTTQRAELLRLDDAPRAVFVVDESVLYRQVGGPKVLADQLSHLRSVIEDSPNIDLRVVPFSAGFIAPMRASYIMVSFDAEPHAHADVVNVEVTPSFGGPLGQDVRSEDSDEQLSDYERAFNLVYERALDAEETRTSIDHAQRQLAAGQPPRRR